MALHRPKPERTADAVVRLLLQRRGMNGPNLIAVRHVRIGNRLVTVELFQNEGRSVAARCVLGSGDTPIIDAPTAEEALAAVEDALEGLLLARECAAA